MKRRSQITRRLMHRRALLEDRKRATRGIGSQIAIDVDRRTHATRGSGAISGGFLDALLGVIGAGRLARVIGGRA